MSRLRVLKISNSQVRLQAELGHLARLGAPLAELSAVHPLWGSDERAHTLYDGQSPLRVCFVGELVGRRLVVNRARIPGFCICVKLLRDCDRNGYAYLMDNFNHGYGMPSLSLTNRHDTHCQ